MPSRISGNRIQPPPSIAVNNDKKEAVKEKIIEKVVTVR